MAMTMATATVTAMATTMAKAMAMAIATTATAQMQLLWQWQLQLQRQVQRQWQGPPYYENLCQLCQCNCVRVHPYAYPQHMMVLIHFLFIQYGCGKQTVVVYNLNNVIMPSFHSHTDPKRPKSGRTLPMYLCKEGAPICLSTANDVAQTLFIHPTKMWKAVSSGLQPQQCHHAIIS